MLILFISSIFFGLILYHIVFHILHYFEKKSILHQKSELLHEAWLQKKAVLKNAREQSTEHLSILQEELDSFLSNKKEELESLEVELKEQENILNVETNILEQANTRIHELTEKTKKQKNLIQENKNSLQDTKQSLILALERTAQSEAPVLQKALSMEYVNGKQLELQRLTKILNEDLGSSGTRLAKKFLERVHTRYSPTFIWPKSSNILELKDKPYQNELEDKDYPFFKDLEEWSGVKITPVDVNENSLLIKASGGFGIRREAARLTLEHLFAGDSLNLRNAKSLFEKHERKLNAEALNLGKKATDILQLPNIHVELQKLIGALYWRTSYRQNQWFHTLEVAQLAGILAHELGVDPKDAKRVGLLHDIGKAIDYRIEGSHAVISGDYSDRYGEQRYICDTVMSHHSDIIIETPLAYILQAADTLSGARPGARVNLEEGYQVRLTAIHDVVKSFPGIQDLSVMNGGREVHIQVFNNQISASQVQSLTEAIARKVEEEVTFPGQIKILVTRTFESSAVA